MSHRCKCGTLLPSTDWHADCESCRRQAIINKRKEEKMDKVWDTILGAILGVSIGFALAGIIASFAYRPTPMFIPRNTAHSIQIDGDTMYYTYIPALEEK